VDKYHVLLTGVTGKFGKVIAMHLINQGYCVVGTGRSQKKLDDLMEQIKKNNTRFHENFIPLEIDLLEHNAINMLLDNIKSMQIPITHIINNARNIENLGVNTNGIVSSENFSKEFLLDVIIPYQLSMNIIMKKDLFLKQIINIGSQYGTVATNINMYDSDYVESPIHYSVAKSALIHLTKEMAIRLAKHSIQVNCISYGGVAGRADVKFQQRYSALCPIGRMLNEEEILKPIDMLMNYPSISLTGHVIHADGGWSLW
jgi:NAD(P)-dependent dehydrogenase (short-subunit alcohol dehydrogenase family)